MSTENADTCIECKGILRAGNVRKRLIVCCDGTDNASDKGIESNATNIGRLSRSFANCGYTKDGERVAQVVHYASGIATGSMSWASNKIQAGLGIGFDQKVCEAYNFLANNYGPGDEIFLFGFSRGAYTARSLASLICEIGLLTPGMMDYFDEIYAEYKKRDRKLPFKECEWAKLPASETKDKAGLGLTGTILSQLQETKSDPTNFDYLQRYAHVHATIKVVGVFDTVGSISMSGWTDQPGTDVTTHSSKLHKKMEHAFHALALDETRGVFAPTLWYKEKETENVDLRQCWFPGYHSDVGGHSDAPSDTNSIDEITFAWMVDQLDGLVQFSERAFEYPILNRLPQPSTEKTKANGKLIDNTKENTKDIKTPGDVMRRRINWSDGTLNETNSNFFHLASLVSSKGQQQSYIREPGVYYASDEQDPRKHVPVDKFRETIHPCVFHRMKTLDYNPVSFAHDYVSSGWIPGFRTIQKKTWTRVVCGNGQGAEWVRTVEGSDEAPIKIKEYVIPNLKDKDLKETHNLNHWSGSLDREISEKCVPEHLAKLDQQNSVLLKKSTYWERHQPLVA